jgi:hypothetical protein
LWCFTAQLIFFIFHQRDIAVILTQNRKERREQGKKAHKKRRATLSSTQRHLFTKDVTHFFFFHSRLTYFSFSSLQTQIFNFSLSPLIHNICYLTRIAMSNATNNDFVKPNCFKIENASSVKECLQARNSENESAPAASVKNAIADKPHVNSQRIFQILPEKHISVHIFGDEAHPQQTFAAVAQVLRGMERHAFSSVFLFTTKPDHVLSSSCKVMFNNNLMVFSDVGMLQTIQSLPSLENQRRLLLVDVSSLSSLYKKEQREVIQFIVNAHNYRVNTVCISNRAADVDICDRLRDHADVSVFIPTEKISIDYNAFISGSSKKQMLFPEFVAFITECLVKKGAIARVAAECFLMTFNVDDLQMNATPLQCLFALQQQDEAQLHKIQTQQKEMKKFSLSSSCSSSSAASSSGVCQEKKVCSCASLLKVAKSEYAALQQSHQTLLENYRALLDSWEILAQRVHSKAN